MIRLRLVSGNIVKGVPRMINMEIVEEMIHVNPCGNSEPRRNIITSDTSIISKEINDKTIGSNRSVVTQRISATQQDMYKNLTSGKLTGTIRLRKIAVLIPIGRLRHRK